MSCANGRASQAHRALTAVSAPKPAACTIIESEEQEGRATSLLCCVPSTDELAIWSLGLFQGALGSTAHRAVCLYNYKQHQGDAWCAQGHLSCWDFSVCIGLSVYHEFLGVQIRTDASWGAEKERAADNAGPLDAPRRQAQFKHLPWSL